MSVTVLLVYPPIPPRVHTLTFTPSKPGVSITVCDNWEKGWSSGLQKLKVPPSQINMHHSFDISIPLLSRSPCTIHA